MSDATALTEGTFKEQVASGVTLVDFWAEWCGPCKMLAPTVDELAKEYDGKATIAKVDIDSEGGLAQEYGVSSIPTVLVIKDGQEVDRFIGVVKKEALSGALDKAIG
jgi:thioredoxin 1